MNIQKFLLTSIIIELFKAQAIKNFSLMRKYLMLQSHTYFITHECRSDIVENLWNFGVKRAH